MPSILLMISFITRDMYPDQLLVGNYGQQRYRRMPPSEALGIVTDGCHYVGCGYHVESRDSAGL